MRKVLLTYVVLLCALISHAQDRVVTGKVTSSDDGSPIPGVNVVLKGTNNGTVTDAGGTYRLTVPGSGGTLIFSFIGMQTSEQEIGTRSTIDLPMASDVKQLSEVVVTALGEKVDKDKFASASSNVQGSAVVRSGETSVLTGLSGKASGVLITRSGGDPGAGAYIQIRGQNTINGNSQPLVVIDGIPMSNSSEGTNAVMQQSRLNDLNPEDIASMEVLKGASAAALWGTRAANGVIMITTKKGKDSGGKLNIEFKSTLSVDVINKMHPLQTAYGQGRNGFYNGAINRIWGDKIADRTGGADNFITDPNDPAYLGYVTFPDGTRRYNIAPGNSTNPHGGKNSKDVWDHTNDVFRNGHFVDNSLAISGGNAKSSFYLGINNLDQQGIIKTNSDYKKNSVRLNLSNNVSEWLRVAVNANYVNVNSNRVQQGDNVDGLLLGMLRTPPDFNNNYFTGAYTDPSGNTFPGRHVSYRNRLGINANPGFANPLWNINNITNTTNVDRIIGNVELNINPTEWLSITGRSGVDNFVDTRVYNYPLYSANYADGRLEKEYITERQFNNDLFAKASKVFNENFSLTGLIGVNYNSRYRERVVTSITNFIIPEAPPLLNNALNTNLSAFNESSLIRTYAYYAQVNFEALNMLYVELTGRNESASTFGPKAAKSFFFPSASLAWQFTKLIDNKSFLSFGKVRLAYGEVGIQPIPYLTQTTFGLSSFFDGFASGLVGSSSKYAGGYSRSYTYGNELLGPERKAELEVGTDLRFLNDNLTLGVTLYSNTTSDIIIQLTTPPSTAYTSSWRNAAKVENKGLEIDLGYNVINRGDFRWTATANVSMNRNKVLSLAGSDAQYLPGAYESALVEGKPFGVFYDVDFLKDEATGKYILDANGFPSGGTKPGVIGDPNPQWRGGLNNKFTYKNFTLEALFDAVQGNQIWSGARGALFNYGTHALVGKETVSNVDLRTNTGVLIPAGTPFRGNIGDFGGGPVALTETWYNGGGGGAFDGASQKQFVFDGSLVRLRQISFSYTLNSPGFRKATKLSSIDFNFTGRNLGLWTNYIGVDPESNQTQAGSLARGEDWFVNPSTKSYLFTVRITY
ncbi:MAG: SusC/RagA family TonB-linked outer membrane protein [Cyclobacteriaceae bacterium]|nr:SusC/RagA family TonB-linked outer membrane protein [Cyclobacteriaceae bacterium]